MRTNPGPIRRAFTLLELLISTGVVGVLLGAVGGVIVLAVRAIPANQAGTQGAIEAAALLARITGELRMAATVNEGSATMIDFTVPDRNGDGADEQIRYEWHGADDGTITRTLNGGEAQIVASGIAALDICYRVATTATSSTGPWVTGAESMLVSYDTGSPGEFVLASGRGVGMSVTPAVDSTAICYAVTRVAMRFRNSGNSTDGRVRVQVRLADSAGLPTSTVLGEATLNESALSSSVAFVTVPITGAAGLSPGTRIAVVALHDAGSEAAAVGTFTRAPGGTDLTVTTTDGGTAWTSSTTTSVCLRVICTVTTTTVTNHGRNMVERVNIHLRSALEGAPTAHASIALTNAPEVE